MKARSLIAVLLGITLGLLGLVGYLAYQLRRQSESITLSTARLLAEDNKTANSKPSIRVVPLQRFTLLDWRSIESTNYSNYIANLRATGCPEETIRDIVIADINKEYAKKRATLMPAKQVKYWLPRSDWQDQSTSSEVRKELRQLEKDRRALIKTLLGIDETTELKKYAEEADQFQEMFGFLSDEKQSRIRDWQEKYEDRESELRQQAHGFLTIEDEEELGKLHEAQRLELEKLLTPEELEQYEIRNSDTAEQLRSGLVGIQPTEEEFKALYKLRKSFNEKFESGSDAGSTAKREQAERELNDQIKQILGNDRATTYQYAQDEDYQNLAKLGSRFEVPKENLMKVHDLKGVMEDEATKIQLNLKLSSAQRQRALAALKSEMEKAVGEALGEKAFKAYRRQAGQWLEEYTVPVEIQDPGAAAQTTQ